MGIDLGNYLFFLYVFHPAAATAAAAAVAAAMGAGAAATVALAAAAAAGRPATHKMKQTRERRAQSAPPNHI